MGRAFVAMQTRPDLGIDDCALLRGEKRRETIVERTRRYMDRRLSVEL